MSDQLITGTDFIVIPTEDIKRAEHFYGEVLGLPFSTYRRHLARAHERLTDLLWAVEIGEVRLAGEQQVSNEWSGR